LLTYGAVWRLCFFGISDILMEEMVNRIA